MKRFLSLISLVAFTAACGDGTSITAPPNDNGTSVMSDGGTPTPDVSPDSSAVDAAVDNDATPPNDTPVVTNDAGMPSDCWQRLCGRVLVITVDGMTYEQTINCPTGTNQIGLVPLSCIATCGGDGCTCAIEGSDPPDMTALVTNDRSMNAAACGNEFAVTLMRNGAPMPPSHGTIVRLRRMSM